MSRIVLLLTRTPWQDFRLYDIQGPALVEAGHEVIYVSGGPEGNTEHSFIWITISAKERWLARRTGCFSLFRRIVILKPDVVQLCSFEQLPLGILLKLMHSCRVIYDCREDMASALYERSNTFPLWVRKIIYRSVRTLESVAGYCFDGIITADPGVYELFESMPPERKLICFNTALLKQFPSSFPQLSEREYDVAVLGSMSSFRSGTHELLDALNMLHLDGLLVKMLLIGEPENEMAMLLRNRINRFELMKYVHITGWLPHSAVPYALARARIGIVPLLDYPKFHRNIACKAFEYMACGMPIVASDLPPQRLFLNDEIAIFYPPGDIYALSKAIQSLLLDLNRSDKMGKIARAKVEKEWNGEIEQEKLKLFYFKIVRLRRRKIHYKC
jgi:glycosyltransferase involved in cell wall biosynthesis